MVRRRRRCAFCRLCSLRRLRRRVAPKTAPCGASSCCLPSRAAAAAEAEEAEAAEAEAAAEAVEEAEEEEEEAEEAEEAAEGCGCDGCALPVTRACSTPGSVSSLRGRSRGMRPAAAGTLPSYHPWAREIAGDEASRCRHVT